MHLRWINKVENIEANGEEPSNDNNDIQTKINKSGR